MFTSGLKRGVETGSLQVESEVRGCNDAAVEGADFQPRQRYPRFSPVGRGILKKGRESVGLESIDGASHRFLEVH